MITNVNLPPPLPLPPPPIIFSSMTPSVETSLIDQQFVDTTNEVVADTSNTSTGTQQPAPTTQRRRTRKHVPTIDSESFQELNHITYQTFYKNPTDLKKLKIPQLKFLAAKFRLHRTGNKSTLIDRIVSFFRYNVCAVQMQRIMRGFFVKRSFQLRGPAYKNRSVCVNQSDFYTLEPLEDISHFEFYSYTDESNFTYGFNLMSLVTLLKRKGRGIMNPYNRSKIPEAIIGDIIRLYWYTVILHPECVSEADLEEGYCNQLLEPIHMTYFLKGYYYGFPAKKPPQVVPPAPALRDRDLTPFRLEADVSGENALENTVINAAADGQPQQQPADFALTHELLTRHLQFMRRQLEEISTKPQQVRVSELFMEIDQLGNYTNISWMNDLTMEQLFRYYFQMNDLWRHQAQLSYTMKVKLSPLLDPFHQIQYLRRNAMGLPKEEILEHCLSMMELLVYTAFDIEDRKLGAMLVLMGLTRVSLPARQALFWLYE
jgi:hypothetical protein